MTSLPRSIHSVVIALLLFLATLFWGWTQLDDRPVNGKGLGSDWFSLETWLTPLANHPALGQAGVNLGMLNDVYFVDAQHGWAVGKNGIILVTNNGGQHWQVQSSGVAITLQSVRFTDTQHGWAVGWEGIILATDNGGQYWKTQSSSITTELNSVHFIDNHRGWAVGDNGIVLVTNTGGKLWKIQGSGVTTWLTAIQFTDAQHGWIVGENGIILVTENSGKLWQPQSSGVTERLYSIRFTDAQHGWVVGRDGLILTTVNGGKNWQRQTSGLTPAPTSVEVSVNGGARFSHHTFGPTPRVNSVHFTDAQHGWAVTSHGDMLATKDGGQHWQVQSNSNTLELNSVWFIDVEHGWAVGDNGTVLVTNNGGQRWQAQSSSVIPWLYSVQFADTQYGWAVGENGVILHTDNGGQRWQAQSSGVTAALFSVDFTDSVHGWAVGDNGSILTTNNGGQRWHVQNSGIIRSLTSVNFTDAQHGWAVGWGGIILATDNGGQHWKAQSSGVKTILVSVRFADAQHGWAVGQDGIILTTNNGGKNWQIQASGVTTTLALVQFVDVQHGWIVGQNGIILTTDNGGQRWQTQTSGITTNLNSVQFTDAQHGRAVGMGGTILATNNGGRSWQAQTSGIKTLLRSVEFTDAQHGWAVGQNGVILITENGGATWQNISPPLKIFGQGHGTLAIFPSPLALLLQALTTLLLFWQAYRYWALPRSLQGGISDAPIASHKDDRLGRLALVKTLADLIRNRDTVPPLAIAVTAPWGSGKSSVLGLLAEQLAGEVFIVQLNAWHYRDDGQLLAALMEHIRAQALPPLLSLDNLWFRARLLAARWFSGFGLHGALFVAASLAALAYFAKGQDWQALGNFINTEIQTLAPWLQAYQYAPWFYAASVLLAGLVLYRTLKSAIAVFSAFSPELVALATHTAKSVRAAVKTPDWAKDAGLRFRFAEDFEAVAKALGKGRLLLLIDDLDRCEPKQVESVMSTLNFLFSTKAPCYALLAMDWDYVTSALGLAFKDIAVARVDSDAKGKAFAEHYVEKIIQISINLPAVDSSTVAELDNSRRAADNVVDWWGKLERHWPLPANRFGRFTLKAMRALLRVWVSVLWRGLEACLWLCWQGLKQLNFKMFMAVYDGLLIMALALLLSFGAVQLGLKAQQFMTKPLAVGTAETVTPVEPEPNAKPDAEKKTIAPPKAEDRPIKVEFVDEPLYPTDTWLSAAAAGLLLALLLMVWRLRLQVQDTQVFIAVMSEWRDWLARHHDTPRDWKRLMNRARLFAMRLRVHQYRPWYDNFDQKWRAFRFQSAPVGQPPVVLDERLAMHLMILDVYCQGELVGILQKYVDYGSFESLKKPLGAVLRERRLAHEGDKSSVDDGPVEEELFRLLGGGRLPVLNDLFNWFCLVYMRTDAGNEAREQLRLWLSLYAGLNKPSSKLVQSPAPAKSAGNAANG